jgi:hypothetical protein
MDSNAYDYYFKVIKQKHWHILTGMIACELCILIDRAPGRYSWQNYVVCDNSVYEDLPRAQHPVSDVEFHVRLCVLFLSFCQTQHVAGSYMALECLLQSDKLSLLSGW